MEIGPGKTFASPREEIDFLRAELARREQHLLSRSKEVDGADVETMGKDMLAEYGEFKPDVILDRSHRMQKHEITLAASSLSQDAAEKADEIFRLAQERGIRNALTVLEKTGDAFLTDEVHRMIVSDLHQGKWVADLKEGAPLFKVFNMTLFEVALPEHKNEDGEGTELSTIMAAMEQFYAGMQTVGTPKAPAHYTLEIAVSDKSDDIVFYVAVPTTFANLFEKQILSLFPRAVLTEQPNDYNIFVENGVSLVSVAAQERDQIYPLKTHEAFEKDPLNVLLNAFSKIERDGGGAAVQLTVGIGGDRFRERYKSIVKRIEDGDKPKVAIRKSTFMGDLYESLKDIVTTDTKKKKEAPKTSSSDTDALEVMRHKMDSPTLATNLRIAVSAKTKMRAEQIVSEIEAAFRQFENTKGNRIRFTRASAMAQRSELRAFSFREYIKSDELPLSITELATLIHFPSEGVESSPQFKQSRAKAAAAPIELPSHGTLLGENVYRNARRDIRITPEDRLRHFYIIGQTGTGKTALIKNMIVQDIKDGAGVCMIDPHGTDIVDVLAAVPEHRRRDVIYFDPARTDRVIGLNMLEYDPAFPEQKTFVVNELFSIFQKLYGAIPESMGPIFEQYFRNATLLVLEDPESGNTLLDVSRVMAEADYRNEKIQKAKNPVVVKFWTDIATKAGGEASLENIVPYITSKFDIFTANDYMRPIIGQQHSTFNFRKLMDEKKIFLVNLSKGRIGEINANLLGMIIVGKFLMAALSRVDDPSMKFPPFYLYIDEFQNVTTDSAATILSEARKYKLGLTVAHQYVAQLGERIRDAVFGNVGSLAAFRVGPEDAEFLSKQFEPSFDRNDLMNIQNWHAYVRMLANGTPTRPFSIKTLPPEKGNRAQIDELIEQSYATYGVPRRKVEMEISARYQL